jgi:hypothetical protein
MNTKTIFTTVAVALFVAVVLTGTVVGTQYVSACHGHHGHALAMSSGGISSGGGSSSGSSGGY